jgi:hypothetical protein
MTYADALLQEIIDSNIWPLWRERSIQNDIDKFRAIYESNDVDKLISYHSPPFKLDNYQPDGLPMSIVDTYADMVIGEFEVKAGHPDDEDNLEAIIEANLLEDGVCVDQEQRIQTDGEIYWRVYIDKMASDYPIISWHSREAVVPLLIASKLKAIALFNAYESKTGAANRLVDMPSIVVGDDPVANSVAVYRHFEIIDDYKTINTLFLGNRFAVGYQVPLDSIDETADLDEEIENPFGEMLAGVMKHREASSRNVGRSILSGIWRKCLELNDHNSRFARESGIASTKVMVDSSLADQQVDATTGQLIGKPTINWENTFLLGNASNIGESIGDRIQEVTITFDSAARTIYGDDLRQNICIAVGMSTALLNAGGRGDTGVALASRFYTTAKKASSFGKTWDKQLPRILRLAQMVDSLPEDGIYPGFGRPYSDASAKPKLKRGPVLPETAQEQAASMGLKRAAGIISREESIRELHEDWTDEQIALEVALLEQEDKLTLNINKPSVQIPMNNNSNSGKPE